MPTDCLCLTILWESDWSIQSTWFHYCCDENISYIFNLSPRTRLLSKENFPTQFFQVFKKEQLHHLAWKYERLERHWQPMLKINNEEPNILSYIRWVFSIVFSFWPLTFENHNRSLLQAIIQFQCLLIFLHVQYTFLAHQQFIVQTLKQCHQHMFVKPILWIIHSKVVTISLHFSVL